MEPSEGHETTRRDVEGALVRVVHGDLTAQGVEAVVNPANEQLQHGAGVAHALAVAGGSVVEEESDRWVAHHGRLEPGMAAVTSGGNLPASHIIHVVGPRYAEGQDNEALLRQAVRTALDAAAALDLGSVALPAISTGVFGYPSKEAAAVIASETLTWLQTGESPVGEIRLVAYDDDMAEAFAAGL